MVLKNKILCGVLVVVVIVCLLQKETFSHTHPSSESFGKIALGGIFMHTSAPGEDLIVTTGQSITINTNTTYQSIVIESGGTLIINNGIMLTVTGDWTNNGTFDAGTGGIVEFSGSTSAIISGATAFEELIISKGSLTTTLTIADNAMVLSGGSLTLNSGRIQVPAGGSFSINPSNNLAIPSIAGFDVNGGTLTTGNFDITNEGLIRVSAGTANFGDNSNNSIQTQAGGAFQLSGGAVNVAGGLEVLDGTADISGGLITLNTVGHTSATLATLQLGTTAGLNMTNGTIIFQQPNSSGYLDVLIANGTGVKSMTGGTLQFGDMETTPTPIGFSINSEIPIPNIETYDYIDLELAHPLTITNQISYGTNSRLELNGHSIQIPATSIGTYSFPLTDNGALIPLTVQVTGGSGTGTLSVSTSVGKHSNNANLDNYLNRQWDIDIVGIAGLVYDINATYNPTTDIVGTESAIAAGAYGGSLPWQKFGPANTTSHAIAATGLTDGSMEISGITAAPPTVSVSASANPICSGESTTLIATASGDPTLTYAWSSDPTGTYPTTSALSVSPTVTTTYTVTVTDGNGFESSNTIIITVNELPAAPTAGTNNYTYDGTTRTAIATVPADIVVDWYTTETGMTSTNAPIATNVGTYSAWAEARHTTTGCISASRTEVILTINKAELTVAAIAPDITYGDAEPTVTVQYSGFTGGDDTTNLDDVSFALGTDYTQFDPVGTYNISIAIGTASDNNYNFTPLNTSTFEVGKRPLSPAVTAENKCYDGTATATLDGQTLNGVINNDDVSLVVSVANFDDTTDGTNKTVTATGLSLTGAGAGNYELSSNTASTTANIYPLPVPTLDGDFTVCSGDTGAIYTTESGMTDYDWSITGGTITSGGSSSEHSVTVTWGSAGTGSISINYTNSNGCTATSPIVQTITVNPTPTINSPGDRIYCMGEITPEIILTGSPGGVVFDISGGTAIGLSNQTGVTKIPSYTAITGSATITITPRANGCAGTPITFGITVNPRPNIQTPTSSQEICSGETTNISLSSSTLGTTFNWIVADAGVVTGASDGSGPLIGQTLENKTSSISYVTYQITAEASGCEGATRNFTVTVHPEVTASISGGTTICQNDLPSDITFTASGGSAPYTFTYNINGGASQQVISSPGNSVTVSVPTDADGTFSYNLVSVSGSTNCPYPQSAAETIIINPQPSLTSSLSPPGICSNEAFNYTPTSDVAGTTFGWTRAAVAGISNPTSSGTDNPNETLINTTTSPVEVTYTYTLTANGCTNTQEVKVLVTQSPELTSPPDAGNICGGTTFTYTPSSNINPGTTFSWYRDADSYGNSANSGTGNISEILYNNAANPITVFYHYTLSSNGCANPTDFLVDVAVTPAPIVNANASETTICPGESINLTSSSNITSGFSILWTTDTSPWTSTEANPTNIIPDETTTYTVTYTDPVTGCSGNESVTVNVHPAPDATIHANYCVASPKIRLTTGLYESYYWQPLPLGETNGNQFIDIDIAGIYTVTVTDANGCSSTSSINVSNEYITNGDFSLGNVGFVTPPSGGNQYQYVADDPSVQDELNPEGFYGIGTNANNYHTNFWGVDHTSGTGNFMIVNGFPGSPQPIVWQQTINNLEPNTNYYFSAWAISLNSAGNDAQLRFSINGNQLGTTADLTEIPGVSNNTNPWHNEGRFYGVWNSGSNTSAVLSIVDLQTATGGNDFGIDDISFGILDPAPADIEPAKGSDICSGETLYLYSNVTDGKEPITFLWEFPNGLTSTEENPVIPNADETYEGTYTLTVTDWYGCDIVPQMVDVVVHPQPTVDAGDDQSAGCSANNAFSLSGTIGGSASAATWTSSGTGTFDDANLLTTTYYASNEDIIAGTVTLTLTTDDPASSCSSVTDNLTISIHPSPEITLDINHPPCHGENAGSATANVTNGTAPFYYLWSDGQTTQTATDLTVGPYSVTVTDANGCSDTETFDIVEPDPLDIFPASFVPPTCYGGDDGTAVINAVGGTPPYVYLWDAATGNQTTQTAYNLPVGVYQFTVTDANGCNITTDFVLVTQPQPEDLICPPDPDPVQADPGGTTAAVTLQDPTYSIACHTISWTMSGATVVSTPQPGVVPSPYTFNVGTTTVEYSTINVAGDPLNCTFDVVVTPNDPPDINCVDPPSVSATVDQCSAQLSISLPTINAGTNITWSWIMTGATTRTGNGAIPSPYTFNVGITEIEWTATNIAGTDVCTQTITVSDDQDPTFTPPNDLEECVSNIITATYNPLTVDINPNRPEYYTFRRSDLRLDLDPLTFNDNCAIGCDFEIRWRIDFSDGTAWPSVDPATFIQGQPSAYLTTNNIDILFPGDQPPYDDNLVHTITYWIADCHGNPSAPRFTTITIKPRPNITKM